MSLNNAKKIFVKAKVRAKKEYVETVGACRFVVAVKEPPREGKANAAIARALAAYFKVPFSSVRLVSGAKGKEKVFAIPDRVT